MAGRNEFERSGMTNRVHLERNGGVAVFVIDNPPINAGSAKVLGALLSAIGALKADANLQAAVIIGAGNTFVAGSDLREFSQLLEEPQLPTVIAAIEGCGKAGWPRCRARRSAAASSWRWLAMRAWRVPAPWSGCRRSRWGHHPKSWSTQRLPRIVGVPRAIRMVCSSEWVKGDAALALGLADELATGDLRAAAVAHARRQNGAKSLLRDRPVPPDTDSDITAAGTEAQRAGRNRPAVLAAIDAVKSAGAMPFDDALRRRARRLPDAAGLSRGPRAASSVLRRARGGQAAGAGPASRRARFSACSSSAPERWAAASRSPRWTGVSTWCCWSRTKPSCSVGAHR